MPRSPAQSDFAVSRATPTLPVIAAPVELPHAAELAAEAGELATRWILRLTAVLLLAFAILCAVGPHLPGGE